VIFLLAGGPKQTFSGKGGNNPEIQKPFAILGKGFFVFRFQFLNTLG